MGKGAGGPCMVLYNEVCTAVVFTVPHHTRTHTLPLQQLVPKHTIVTQILGVPINACHYDLLHESPFDVMITEP